jgi:hypothetical protein
VRCTCRSRGEEQGFVHCVTSTTSQSGLGSRTRTSRSNRSGCVAGTAASGRRRGLATHPVGAVPAHPQARPIAIMRR